ncbi:MAG: alginate export family protein [Ferruginibacter sp.]
MQTNTIFYFLSTFIIFSVEGICQKPTSNLPPIQLVRYKENYDSIKIQNVSLSFIEKIKHIDIDKKPAIYISFGAEVREAYEFHKNPVFGLRQLGSDGFWLQRYHLHADLHVTNIVRTFLQLGSAIKIGGIGKPSPIQEDKLFMHQAFVQVALPGKTSKPKVIINAGRQEIEIGSGRFVSIRIGPNIRQSFDALRVIILDVDNWSFNAFYSRPVKNQQGYFDNETFSDKTPDFWNISATHKLIKISSNIDLYYWGLRNKDAEFVQGSGRELRHSFGARVFANQKLVDYDAEVMYQFGDFNNSHISAYTVSVDAGYTFTNLKAKPRIGLKTQIASGDRNPSDAHLQTFNSFFPESGGYFAGVSNLFDLHPSVDLDLNKIKLKSAVAFVWRQSNSDGLYSPGRVIIIKDAGFNKYSYIGTQVQQTAFCPISRYVSFRGIYQYFFAGKYLSNSHPKRHDETFFTVMVSLII